MTDYYSAVELAARNLVKAELPSYFPPATADTQVTKSDATVYDYGFDYYFTTYPGAFPTLPAGVQMVEVTWEILVDVLSRFNSNEAQAWIDFTAFRSDVFNLFNVSNKGRNLDRASGVRRVLLASEERPRYIPLRAEDEDSPPAFIAQVCILNVTQVINKS